MTTTSQADLIRSYVDDNPGAVEFLNRIVEYEDGEQERYAKLNLDSTFVCWTKDEVGVPRKEIDPLLFAGIVRVQSQSSKRTNFVLVDREAIREALPGTADGGQADGPVTLPDDFMDIIELREDEKSLITDALLSTEPVHVLLVGPPASSKSLILREIKRAFPGHSRYTTGGAVSKAGLVDYLIVNRPRYLCMDEVDYIPANDQNALLGLMEDGTVTRLKYGKRDTVQLQCWVFGACNRADRFIPGILSRFFTIYLTAYDRDQFRQVAAAVMYKREGVDEALAGQIADQLAQFTTDPRDAVKIARLASSPNATMERLEKYIRMMRAGKRQ